MQKLFAQTHRVIRWFRKRDLRETEVAFFLCFVISQSLCGEIDTGDNCACDCKRSNCTYTDILKIVVLCLQENTRCHA